MKKRENKMMLLLVILCVLICVLLLIKILTPAEEAAVEPELDRLLDFDPAKVTALSWEYDGQTIAFTCDGGKWSYVDDPEATAVFDTLNRMVGYLADARVSRTIEEPDVLASYGLEEPACTIWLSADGKDYEIRIGDINAVTHDYYENIREADLTVKGDYYLSIGDGKVYMEGGEIDLIDSFDVKLTDIVLLPETEEEAEETEETEEVAEESEEAASEETEEAASEETAANG